MTLKFNNITNIELFFMMSSSDAMFEASSVYFLHVKEQAAHIKIDVFTVDVNLGRSKSLISLVVERFLSARV